MVDVDKKAFLEVLRKNLGLITPTLKALGIDRETLGEWMIEDEKFKEEVEYIVFEEVVDFVESKLYEKIAEGNTTAILFFLKTKGKRRGYTENVTVNHISEDKKISIKPIKWLE